MAIRWPSLGGKERQHGLLAIGLIGIALSLVCVYFVNYTPFFSSERPDESVLVAPVSGTDCLPGDGPAGGGTESGRGNQGLRTVLGLRRPCSGTDQRGGPRSDMAFGAPGASSCPRTAFVPGRTGGIVVMIAQSRAGMGLDYIYQGHYLTLMLPMLCAVVFRLGIHGYDFGTRCSVCNVLGSGWIASAEPLARPAGWGRSSAKDGSVRTRH